MKRQSSIAVMLITLVVTLLVLATFAPRLAAQGAEKKTAQKTKLKGLLVAGGCCHDYERQVEIITEGLSQRASISWDVVYEGKGRDTKVSIYKNPDWSKGYDIVVHNECD